MALALASLAAPRSVSVLGATGSVGRSTLDLIARTPERYRVEALTAHRNVEGLAQAALRHRARLAVIGEPAGYRRLKELLAGSDIEVAAGPDALLEAAARPADWVMAAIVGAAGLGPTLTAVRRAAMVALATKECLVCAGALLMAEVARSGAVLLPVDSEHNAIFQALRGEATDSVERLILTASGGPFRRRPLAEMAAVTPGEAVAHPNWRMGAKISVDSATMMNKGLELIEAFHLFGLAQDRIEILVHPESIVHSMVAFQDGSVLAQLGQPDMRIPIAYTLGWPERISAPTPRLDLAAIGRLTFERPDHERFPALGLAGQALRQAGSAPTVLNAANEIAVEAFLAGRIGFLEVAAVVDAVLQACDCPAADSLDDVLEVDAEARRRAGELVAGKRVAALRRGNEVANMAWLGFIGTYLIPFLLILSVVVFVHELGHYLVARRNGVRVDVFSIGFGTELFGFNDRAGTRWKFSVLPLGGYVKMHGDADPTSSTIDLNALPDPDSFPAKSVWQRMAIVAAGPLANFVFAIVALGLLFATVGRPVTPAEVGEVQPGSAAEAAGLLPGDRIVAVDGEAAGELRGAPARGARQPGHDAAVQDRARRRRPSSCRWCRG